MTKTSPKLMTLCLIHQDERLLLGTKKRGFGKDRINGFGGKVESGESIEQAAIRETQEEAGITPIDLKKIGIIHFEFEYQRDVLEVHLFKSTEFEGEPTETEEMKPEWFSASQIPFDRMWPDDIHWMSLFLANKTFCGRFFFDKNDKIVEMELNETTLC